MKKISVLMATYNGSEYIEEQMQSIYDQTLVATEVLIRDDQSQDNTVELIRKFIKTYDLTDHWKIIINEENLGYANNFHKLLEEATGDYIFFSDQDDVWFSNKIEEMVNQMECNRSIKLLCCDFEPIKSADHAPEIAQHVLNKMTDDGRLEAIVLNRKNIFIGSLGCVMAITKQFRDDILPFWFDGWAHDEYVWKLAQCYKGAYFYHKNLIGRRLHANNVSMRKMHDLRVRVKFFDLLLKSHKATLECALEQNMGREKLRIINRNIKSLEYRIQLLRKGEIRYCLPLLFYTDCYHSRKSIVVEPYLVLKNLSKER